MKILILDDDEDLLKMSKRRFERKEFTVITTKNILEASCELKNHPDTLAIICDYYLQNGENGILFYENFIRNQFKGVFILATGDDISNLKIEEYQRENNKFKCYEKPYSIDTVAETIKSSA
jgi:DNA-binding NtrC family response regulator